MWDEIVAKCPKLYQRGMDFECGDGWQKIVRHLSFQIEKVLEKTDRTDMFAVQVKEKYGRLRFYMSQETREIQELISDTEALSTQTCELCGYFAKMRGSIVCQVRCDKCFKESHE
jgi:hypothetical protein